MPLVTLREVLPEARKHRFAVGAFNVYSLDTIPVLIELADEEKVPIIIQVTSSTMRLLGANNIASLATTCARRSASQIVLHLDHADSLDPITTAVQAGFSSVMIDGSRLVYEENVRLTRQVVELASRAGISVEGELGTICSREDDYEGQDALFTDPDGAREFVAETGIDALAVAIGTRHGFYRSEPRLDFARLEAIRQRVSISLVLHGGSGTPPDQIQRTIQIGISKINVATELKFAWVASVRKAVGDQTDEMDPRTVVASGLTAIRDAVRGKIRLFRGTRLD